MRPSWSPSSSCPPLRRERSGCNPNLCGRRYRNQLPQCPPREPRSRFSGGSHGPPSELNGSCEPPGRLVAAFYLTGVSLVCFRAVSRVSQNGFVGTSRRYPRTLRIAPLRRKLSPSAISIRLTRTGDNNNENDPQGFAWARFGGLGIDGAEQAC